MHVELRIDMQPAFLLCIFCGSGALLSINENISPGINRSVVLQMVVLLVNVARI